MAAKTRLALVRGATIGRGEVSWWNSKMSPRGYEVTGFATTQTALTDIEIGEPVRRLPSLIDLPKFMPGLVKKATNVVLPYVAAGMIDRLMGLEKALQDYDIYYASETYRGYTAQCAQARLKYNRRLVVYVFENIPFVFERHPILRRNKKITLQATDLFIAATERAAEALILEGVEPKKIQVIYPGVRSLYQPVDYQTRLDLRQKHGFKPDEILALFVGRLHKTKGVQELLYAVDTLSRRRPNLRSNFRLLIIGRGAEVQFIRQYIKDKELEQCIRLPGFLSPQALSEFYQMADMFVLPSNIDKTWQEQFGKVLAEAMASGLPVITTHSGSIDEVVGDAALLVPPNDFYRLSRSIEQLIDNPELRAKLGRLGRARAEERFNLHKEMDRIGDAFDKLKQEQLVSTF